MIFEIGVLRGERPWVVNMKSEDEAIGAKERCTDENKSDYDQEFPKL